MGCIKSVTQAVEDSLTIILTAKVRATARAHARTHFFCFVRVFVSWVWLFWLALGTLVPLDNLAGIYLSRGHVTIACLMCRITQSWQGSIAVGAV